MISVDVRNVAKLFGDTRALDDVSVRIEPGELFFLLGPSGCGKTTLLRSIAGFYIPEEGSIHFGEDDVTRLEPHKRNTGMMFQSYALWPHMSVAENVAFGLQQRKVPKAEIKERVDKALDSVQMRPYAERKPNQLSGGQQQRIALARALVIRPRCLLLDEPLSNLDAKLRHEMRNEIRRVCKEFELTTIYVTHDQKEALSIADRMVVMRSGKVLQVGSPLELYKRPLTRFVADFIGESNFIGGEVASSDGQGTKVKTSLGVLACTPSDSNWKPKVGSKVTLSIRPECIQLTEEARSLNSCSGEIIDSTYYGEVAHYHFKSSGEVLNISEINPQHIAGTGRGRLYASAEPKDVIVLSA